MFDGPIRGGTRGGQGEFKWSDVSADKDRENYLGHSINAPTGRWQKNKDVHWYNRDLNKAEAERLEEIRKIKEAEEDALAVALGFKPAIRPALGTEAGPSTVEDGEKPKPSEDPLILAAKEEKRRRKVERRKRREDKRERKELKRLRKVEYGSTHGGNRRIKDENVSDDESESLRRHPTRPPSRSRSPRRLGGRSRGRSMSHSPSRYQMRDSRHTERKRYGDRTREDRGRLEHSVYGRDRNVERL